MYIPEISIPIEDIIAQLTSEQALNLKKGSVILVRSDYANDKYADHASLIVGGKILKDRGLRPNLIVLPNIVWNITTLIDQYKPIDGKVLLLLNDRAAAHIVRTAGLHLSTGELHEIIVDNDQIDNAKP